MNISEVLKERRVQILCMLAVYLGIALWMGGIAFFGFGVAGQVFTISPSRDVAGLLNRAFLHRLNIIEFVSAALLLAGIGFYNIRCKGLLYRVPLFLAVIAVTLLCVYALIITPSMNDLLLQISTFDSSVEPSLKGEFDTYHRLYSLLVQINLFLLFAIFIWQTIIFAGGKDFEKKNDL